MYSLLSAARPSSLGVVLAVLAALLVAATPAAGQEITLEYGVTRAGYDEALQRPAGLSGFVDVPLGRRLALRLSAAHRTERRSVTRSPCTGLVPPGRDCTAERFDVDAHLTTYGAGLALRLPTPAPALAPELYALVTASRVDADFTARNSDATVRPVTPDGLSPGLAFGGTLSYAVTPLLAFTGRIGVQIPRFGVCGVDAWFPFCERRILPELALGAQLRPSALHL